MVNEPQIPSGESPISDHASPQITWLSKELLELHIAL